MPFIERTLPFQPQRLDFQASYQDLCAKSDPISAHTSITRPAPKTKVDNANAKLMEGVCNAVQSKLEGRHSIEELQPQEAATSAAVLLISVAAPDVRLQLAQASHISHPGQYPGSGRGN